ncbi:hypothetical protein RB195_021731 [Necator americanus]|uniref:Uncharacterized protein n=1 Tax=Necator americanus TaxID=51031 RepID=A0ABR1ECE4_NECAM
MTATREILSKDVLKPIRHSIHLPSVCGRHPSPQIQVYLSAIHPIMMYRSETWAAPATVMEKLDFMERKLFRRPLGYFWPLICHNEELYSEVDMLYRRMTCDPAF